jgi:integrase
MPTTKEGSFARRSGTTGRKRSGRSTRYAAISRAVSIKPSKASASTSGPSSGSLRSRARRTRSASIGRRSTTRRRCSAKPLSGTSAPSDIRRFLEHIKTKKAAPAKDPARARELSPATLAKHLRQLGACLEAAVAEGYAAQNPVRKLHRTARPKVAKQRPAYYTDAELSALWPALAHRPVFQYLCKIAVATGMRFGELAALRWADADLLDREVHVSRTYVAGIGEQPTKSKEPRTIDLTPQAAALFEGWYAASGGGDERVFGRETGGYVDPSYMTRRVLYPALAAAGIPRVGERGRERDFHSFRHTFARIALEHGAEITWVQKQLGHSSITLTVDTYGSWARTAEKAQAEKLRGAFAV